MSIKDQKTVCIIHKVRALDPRSYYKQARSLKKAGYNTTILGLQEINQIVSGINIEGFGKDLGRPGRFVITNYSIFRSALRKRADVYHFHDLDFIPWALLLKLMTKSKVIYDIHEAYPEYMLIKTYIPKFMRKIMFYLVYALEHGSVKLYDAIVPNDNFIAADFQHKNNVVIFNFPTMDFFHHVKGTPWHLREYDLFYHGSLPKYHFETMMRIADRLNSDGIGNKWGIVTNDKETIRWAQIEVDKRKLDDNFEFLPYTDYLNIHKYLNRAKIGIIPLPPYRKFKKNIPLKMFEFMGFGMPVVLSDLPPTRQFISEKQCAIAVSPDDINEYSEAIKTLIEDADKAISMGENGRRLVNERYNWKTEEKKLLKLYENLV